MTRGAIAPHQISAQALAGRTYDVPTTVPRVVPNETLHRPITASALCDPDVELSDCRCATELVERAGRHHTPFLHEVGTVDRVGNEVGCLLDEQDGDAALPDPDETLDEPFGEQRRNALAGDRPIARVNNLAGQYI